MLGNAPIRQVAGDLPRRWMADDYFDLYVWYQEDGPIYGFQLAYDKGGHERAITWRFDGSITHSLVDTGEDKPTANRTPVLRPGGIPPWAEIQDQFEQRSIQLDPEIRELVLDILARGSATGA